MKVDRLDHLVLTVRHVEVTCDFYSRVLGMEVITFGGGRRALGFGRQKINLHAVESPISPHAKCPQPGSGDLCFITSSPVGEIVSRLERNGVVIELGPVGRMGATRPIMSVYFRDPDLNLIEVAREGE